VAIRTEFAGVLRAEPRPGLRLEWSAQHLGTQMLPVRSWHQVLVLIELVGTTEWPWLTVQSTQPWRRRATCTGFAAVLTVDVCEWDHRGYVSSMRRLGLGLGLGPAENRWVDVGPSVAEHDRVRHSQVLPARTAVVAFRHWLELGRVDGFTLEEI
jgi:hypothetical protein